MSINLSKGQKLDLSKHAPGGLSKVMVGLGWDEVEQDTGFFGKLFGSKKEEYDCDASVILCGVDGKLVNDRDIKQSLVYFNNLIHSSGAIVHQGDNLTGGGDGDDEQIMVDLNRIPPEISKLVFVVNIYDANKKNQHFGLIQNAFIRLVDMSTRKEICRFNLTDNYDGMTGLIAGEIYRRNGEWRFNAVGRGVKNASRLDALLELYW